MSKIDLATYVATVQVDADGLQSGLSKADQNVNKGLAGMQKKANLAFKAIMVGVTAATIKLSKEVINIGSSFESGMAEVQAISGATGDDLDRLTEKAREMGKNTKYSATESAEALKYMAMAGWKTEDMLDGLDGVMMLAAASGEDLATVSDIVTDALSAFGMEASDAGDFADLLASASANSNTNVSILGESFKMVAPLAGALGYSAEDTALALGLMANAGIKGSAAGTALRNIMSGLVTPTKKSAESISELGIELENADGTMRPMSDVLGDMREKFKDLTPAQKAQHAEMIAGKQGMAGLLAIMEATDEEYEQLIEATTDYNGAAQEMSEIMEDTLIGDMAKFKSMLEDVAIQIYERVMPALRELVQGLTEGIPEAIENISKEIEILKVMVVSAYKLMIKEIKDINEESEGEIAERFENIKNSISENFEDIKQKGMVLFVTIRNAIIKEMDGLIEIFLSTGETVSSVLGIIGTGIEALGIAFELIFPIIVAFAEIFTKALEEVSKAADEIFGEVIRIVQEFVDENEEAFNRIYDTVKRVTDKMKRVIELFVGLVKRIVMKFLGENEDEIKQSLGDVLNVIEVTFDFIEKVLDIFIALFEGDWSKLWESVKSIASFIWDTIKDIISKSLDRIVGILKGMFGIFKSVAKTLFNKIKEAASEKMNEIIDDMPGLIGKILRAFRDKYREAREAGKGMFSAVWDGMKGIWGSLWGWVTSKVSQLADKLAFWRRGKNEMSGGGASSPTNSYAVGTPFVSHDQTALIHKGEAIIPERYNPFTKGGHFKPEFAATSGGSANYEVSINIENVDSGVDLENAIQNGIDKANRKRERKLKKKGI